MLLNTSSLSLLTCLTGADFSGATKLPTKTLDLPLLNTSQAYNAAPSSNSFDILTLPTPHPYGFHVPNTQIYLRIGFGLPRHHLDPMTMGGLMAVVQHVIIEGINENGEEAFPATNIFLGEQIFEWTLGDGYYFQTRNLKTGTFFTWGQLKNVVEGLRLFLIVGERYYATDFSFWDGPGWWRRRPLGFGGLWLDMNRKELIENQTGFL